MALHSKIKPFCAIKYIKGNCNFSQRCVELLCKDTFSDLYFSEYAALLTSKHKMLTSAVKVAGMAHNIN